MKKILAIAAALLLTVGAAIAQTRDNHARGQKLSQSELAQKRTDDMIMRYGLNDRQAKKLFRLNKRFAPSIRHDPATRGGEAVRNAPSQGGSHMEMERKQMIRYEKKLSRILTPEQYRAYQMDVKNHYWAPGGHGDGPKGHPGDGPGRRR